MKQFKFTGIVILCMTAVLSTASCNKEPVGQEDNGYVHKIYIQAPADPGIISQEVVRIDTSFTVAVPPQVVASWPEHKVEVTTPSLNVKNLIDLHLEILPIYVFGTDNGAGDYYAIQGYMVSHNASVFSENKVFYTSEQDRTLRMTGWYMSDFALDLKLLDSQGNAVNNEDVGFFVQPEPSTTIGSTTYTKGFSFSLSPSLTFGTKKVDPEGVGKSGWKTTLLGVVSLGFSWNTSATQNLPDQSVLMWTGPKDRMVSYDFKSNNVKEEMSASGIPVLFRNDQRVDFSYVWFVRSGAYCAKDGDFGQMKMSVVITPLYNANVEGEVAIKYTWVDKQGIVHGDLLQTYVEKYGIESTNSACQLNIDLPSINRIPTGDITIKNCTRSYMTNVRIYRSGEYTSTKIPYESLSGVFGKNESLAFILREGMYDIVYELKNGDTGESYGLYMISDVEMTSNASVTRTTFDGEKI